MVSASSPGFSKDVSIADQELFAQIRRLLLSRSRTEWRTVMQETQRRIITGRLVAAIDPMALLLPEDLYLIWLEIHHPHGSLSASLARAFERATREDRSAAVRQAETLAAACEAVIKAAAVRA
jgi:hypothetical protein